MENFLKNWKKYILKETNDSFAFQIFCDMDGVLVDFESGVVQTINKTITEKHLVSDNKKLKRKLEKLVSVLTKMDRELITTDDIGSPGNIPPEPGLKAARDYMYRLVANDVKFWTNLEWTIDGIELWNYIAPFNPVILSTPIEEGSRVGKRNWIKNNLDPPPRDIILTDEKYHWAIDQQTGHPNILIDDFQKNIVPWIQAGGIGILHTSAQKTIEQLEIIKQDSAYAKLTENRK